MQLKQLYDGLVSSSVRDLSLSASDLKKAMFDHLILKRDLDKKKVRTWLGNVNDYLTYWCGYAEQLSDVMKGTKGTAGIYCLPYADVKDYIYTKYDLPSVLKFADALVKGINEKEFTKTDGIKTLFVEHVNRAFPDRADDVGGLLSEVLQSEGRPTPRSIDKNEAKLFDTAKKFKWYTATDHSTIYKAIETTCTYMTEKYGLQKTLNTSDLKLYVSVINMTVEYMMYTLVAYATRVYMISLYTWPHYMAVTYHAPNDSNYKESTQWDETITTMQETDDMMLRDPKRIDKLGSKIVEFLKLIGAGRDIMPPDEPYKYYRYLSDEKMKDNPFYQQAYDNELLAFLRVRGYEVPSQGRISETKHRLETLCRSTLHGLSTESTAKQGLLHVMRGVKPEAETQEGYRKLASALATFGLNTLYLIAGNISDYERWLMDLREDLYEGQSTKNDADECKKISLELYREIASSMMGRMRDIEMRYNELSGTTLDQINKQLEIKIPGVKSDRSLEDNIATAVPASTRVPLDVIQVYASPVFDEASMYLDWLATKPELQDYWYVQEAAGNPVDNLIAFFQSIWRRIQTFFGGKQFKSAREWVEKNEEVLKNMKFDGITLSSLKPYKDSISVTEHYQNLIKNLSAFNPGMIKSQEDVDKFIASLYENETVASWFPMDGQKSEEGKIRWRNYFLFTDLENTTEKRVNLLTLNTDEDIRKRMWSAIRDIKQSGEWLNQLERLNNQIGSGMQHLKQSTVNIKVLKESVFTEADTDNGGSNDANPKAQSGQDGSGEKPKVETNGQSNQQNTQQSQNAQNDGMQHLMPSVFQGTQMVLNNIWMSSTSMIIEYVNDQYKTITQLYDAATKQQNDDAQRANQQQGDQTVGGQ